MLPCLADISGQNPFLASCLPRFPQSLGCWRGNPFLAQQLVDTLNGILCSACPCFHGRGWPKWEMRACCPRPAFLTWTSLPEMPSGTRWRLEPELGRCPAAGSRVGWCLRGLRPGEGSSLPREGPKRTLSPALFALRQSQCLQCPPDLLITVRSSPPVRACGFPSPSGWGPRPELRKPSARKLLLFPTSQPIVL